MWKYQTIRESLCYFIVFYCRKKPTGEYNTGFVNCFYYGKKEDLPEPKSRVTVSGWLVDSIVNKGGKTYHNLMVGTKDVKVVQNVEDRGEVTYTSTNKIMHLMIIYLGNKMRG